MMKPVKAAIGRVTRQIRGAAAAAAAVCARVGGCVCFVLSSPCAVCVAAAAARSAALSVARSPVLVSCPVRPLWLSLLVLFMLASPT